MSRAAILVLAVASLLAACGGGDEVECRPDFVGPPVPAQADLPVCEVQP